MRIESISRMPSDFTDFASTTLLLPDLADFFALLLLLDAFLLLLFDFSNNFCLCGCGGVLGVFGLN